MLPKKLKSGVLWQKKMAGLQGELFEDNEALSIDGDLEDLEDGVMVQGTEKGDIEAF